MKAELSQFSNSTSADSTRRTERLRAIDALIAQHLMGWRWYNPRGGCSVFTPADMLAGKEVDDHPTRPPKFRLGQDSTPLYSSDPAASKQARDKMRELGWMPAMEYVQNLNDESGRIEVSARFRRFGTTEAFTAQARTEELAVSLAILAALGVEVPE